MELFPTLKGLATLISIARNLTAVAPKSASLLKAALPRTRRAHSSQLRQQLARMPFIYRGLESSLRDDYIETKMAPLPLDRLRPLSDDEDILPSNQPVGSQDVEWLESKAALAMLKDHRRALFIGDAGVGKTTFVSYHILKLLGQSSPLLFRSAVQSSSVIPFFVPLKAVPDGSNAPILNYLLMTNIYLGRTTRGLRRLIDHAELGEVFLVLDGYDEIYVPPKGKTRLIEDIEALFEGRIPQSSMSENETAFYDNMRSNRIWLTSRRTFYNSNRLGIDTEFLQEEVNRWLENRVYFVGGQRDEGAFKNSANLAIIGIRGIVDQRQLVEKIFTKYKEFYLDINVNKFLDFVNIYFEEKVKALSINPLFLTALCYLYVERVVKERLHFSSDIEKRTVRGLVDECVQLLLVDLDKYRVRELDRKLDRTQYHLEKKAFLSFFAAELYTDPKLATTKVFTAKDIERKAKEFFKDNDELVKQIEVKKGLVTQIISQGIFVIVDCLEDETTYDFPHRRFREVLAAQCCEDDKYFAHVLDRIGDKDYQEFVLTVFETLPSKEDAIITQIIACSRAEPQRVDYFATLVAECIQRHSISESSILKLEEWIREMMAAEVEELPISLLQAMKFSREFVSKLSYDLRSSLLSKWSMEKTRRMSIYMAQVMPEQFVNRVVDRLEEKKKKVLDSKTKTLLDVCRIYAPKQLARAIRQLEGATFRRVIKYLCKVGGPKNDLDLWTTAVKNLSKRQWIILVRISNEVSSQLSERLLRIHRTLLGDETK